MTAKTLDGLIRNSKLNVAVESNSSLRNMFTDVFSNNLFMRMRDRADELFVNKKIVHHFRMTSKFDRRIIEWADRESYLNLAEITVFAPIGLKVSYMAYIEALENALPHAITLHEELLRPTLQILGMGINTPSTLMSRSGLVKGGKLMNKDVAEVTKPIAACFDPHDKSDKIQYKQAFRKNGDLDDAAQRLLALQDNVARIDVDVIERKVKDIFSTAEQLAEAMQDDEIYGSVSKRVNKELSDIIYNAAQWVEFFGIYRHQIMVLSEAMKDTELKLKKLAK